ncbi:MAG: hypothetical protein AAF721_41770 [Myxococcota bacterium]
MNATRLRYRNAGRLSARRSRRRETVLAVVGLGLGPGCGPGGVVEPSPASPDANAAASVAPHGPVEVVAPEPEPEPQTGAGPMPSHDPNEVVFSAYPMPTNCQAKLALTEEVARLVHKAAAHATASQACVDGPGVRMAATDVLVCPAAASGKDLAVSVFYRMVRFPESGARGCGEGGRKCEHLWPTATGHRTELRFETNPKKGARLRTPEALPGMGTEATPLTATHDGGCYGKSGPFEAKWIQP